MPAPGLNVRRRILLMLVVVTLAGAGVLGRLSYWQFARGQELTAKATAWRAKEIPIRAPRGDIVDRRRLPLASNLTSESVFAVPVQVRDKAGTALELSRILDRPVEQILEKLNRRSSYEYIKRKVTEEEARAIRTLQQQGGLQGIGLEPEAKRYYPEGSLAAHVLGFAGIDNQGLAGLEYYYDQYLRGENGAIEVEYDARGYEIAGGLKRIVPPRPGLTLVSTIDKAIQLIVERDLEKVIATTNAKRAAIIVMDVRSGEIIALAASPTYDPNRYGEYDPRLWRMWLVADTVSPGSIFKPVTAAGAMEEGLIAPDTPFYDTGCVRIQDGTKPICNWNNSGFGSGTLADVVRTSSNVGFATIGVKLGADRFYKWLEAFNLRSRTGIDIPGEAVGLALSLDQARKHPRDLATQAFGQTLTVSPVQMLAAVNAIANDGRWVQPHLMREMLDAAGNVVRRHNTVTRQVISAETARELHLMMEQVVSSGTGRAAQVKDYRVAGKTGTAEKFEHGVKVEGRYIASFVGFAPVPNPKVSVLVMIDEPQGLSYGGQVAAPVFGMMVGDILRYLGIPPAGAEQSPPEPASPQARVPSVVNLSLGDARQVARESGFVLQVSGGEGMLVSRQFPPAGAEVAPGTPIRVELYEDPPPVAAGEPIQVPALSGLTLRQAAEVLANMGLFVRFEGTGAVVRQDPQPGTPVPRGSRVQLWLQPPG